MKIHKKISIGLVLITALFAGLFFSHTSSAAPSFSAAWIDRSSIQVTGEGKTVVLTDGRWDYDWKYQGNLDGCDTSILNDFYSSGGDSLIIGFSDNHTDTSPTAWNDSVSNAGSLVIKYKAAATDTSCTTAEVKSIHINNWQNARLSYRWTDSSHTSIARIDRASDWTFGDPVNITKGFDAGKTRFFRQSEVGDKCQDAIDVSANKSTMWLYEQKPNNDLTSNKESPIDTNCWLKSTIDHLYSTAEIDEWMNSLPSDFALSLDEPFTPPGVTPPGDVTGTNDACYQSGWELSWLACPVITAAQTAANAMYGFVEDQLKFTVLQNCSTPNCADSLGQQHDSVHSAWSNFRILVSGLVVILLLVMVISQAIGTGPFDAYTVRKMLPRLVIGVILIQISWPLFSWVVNTVDHLGVGLADIMYAPFGGSDALNLNSVMKPFTAEAATFSWVGIPALVIFGVVAPFVVIGLILTVLVAIFVGFLTLLFRKILIILALIFVPVALISWMMPNDGLKKYWKLWWDNFIKALMMFPLIIAVIAAGRIFAKIGSGQSDFVGFFIVLVGFFGPLFILPKTFKWGGSVMQLAGKGISDAGGKLKKASREPIKGWTDRNIAGRFAKKYTPADSRFKRAAYSALGGRIIPSKYQRALLEQRGDKWNEERKAEALANVNRLADTARARGIKGYKKDEHGNIVEKNLEGVAAYKQAMVNASLEGNEREQEMALTRLAQTSSWPEIENNYNKDGKRATDSDNWDKTFINNEQLYPIIQQKRYDQVPHIRNLDYSARQLGELGYARQADGSYMRGADGAVVQAGDKLSAGDRIAVAAKDYMSPQDFATQSQGFWDEAKNIGSPAIASIIRSRLEEVAETGNYGIQVLGAMKGGEQGQRVQEVLGIAGGSLDALIARAQQVAVSGGGRAGGPTQGPGGNGEPRGIVVPPTYRQRAPREEPEEPPAGGPGSPPSQPSTGGNSGTEGGVDIPHDTPPEDFGPDGRFPPPNIPPGPGNV